MNDIEKTELFLNANKDKFIKKLKAYLEIFEIIDKIINNLPLNEKEQRLVDVYKIEEL
ncbi:MAG: hypothetical protein LBM96_06105 [Methanobrevibacter sp.]|jgi:hypothetical protein|nr:hypothetical protein [Candidatus Methanoflexus mossambicus]